MIYIDKLEY